MELVVEDFGSRLGQSQGLPQGALSIGFVVDPIVVAAGMTYWLGNLHGDWQLAVEDKSFAMLTFVNHMLG